MILQNVTSKNTTPHNQLFQLHYANITNTLPVSVHLEVHPLNISLAYLLIYKFDQIPQLNSSINQMDGWSVFCPGNLSNGSIHTYFIDNQRTQGHQSLVFGLRELNSSEMIDYCFSSFTYNLHRLPINDLILHRTMNLEFIHPVVIILIKIINGNLMD